MLPGIRYLPLTAHACYMLCVSAWGKIPHMHVDHWMKAWVDKSLLNTEVQRYIAFAIQRYSASRDLRHTMQFIDQCGTTQAGLTFPP